jgi:HD superfamily phosphohydrolase
MTTDRAEPLLEAAHPLDRISGSGGFARAVRPLVLADPLYGTIRVTAWAAALLVTPPFQRLAGVSLSDVPGELLFGRPFPSRLDHALGVYHLARLARPRDRALQAAALAHDLGHGPFSHLSEPLMIERLGEDHEQRSARLLAEVRAALAPAAARQLDWLDWDDVARLVLGQGADGRGALLNHRLDYDNADNVARFLLASGLGQPSYDPRPLARALRPLPAHLHAAAPGERIYLEAGAEAGAMGWQADRATVYTFLHAGHHNLAAHAMLRKAVDLAAEANLLPPAFFAYTDEQALRLLAEAPARGAGALVRQVRLGEAALHRCVWEGEVRDTATLPQLFARRDERLALEARLASEAGLAPHEVLLDVLASRAGRALPPLAGPVLGTLVRLPELPPAPCLVHLFVARTAAPDYLRRLRAAAQRLLVPQGVQPRFDGGD